MGRSQQWKSQFFAQANGKSSETFPDEALARLPLKGGHASSATTLFLGDDSAVSTVRRFVLEVLGYFVLTGRIQPLMIDIRINNGSSSGSNGSGSNGSSSGKRAATPRPTRQEWFFDCLKGTLLSYLRPGGNSRVTLQQVDGLKRRIQISCGVSEEEIKEAIASWMDAMPYSDSKRVKEIRGKYGP